MEAKTQTKLKVYVKTFDGVTFWGYVFLNDNQRVQDLLNDDRKFIPFLKTHLERGPKNEVTSSSIVINKDAIVSIEEKLDTIPQ